MSKKGQIKSAPVRTRISVDVGFLRPIALFYQAGGFEGKDIPVRVINAIDSINAFFYTGDL